MAMGKNEYVYHLATASEMRALGFSSCKAPCPQCGRKTYKFYVDNAGQMLAKECGKCDRENNCDYHLAPSKYLSENPNGAELLNIAKELPKPQPKNMLSLPHYLIGQMKANNDKCAFIQWFKSLNIVDNHQYRADLILNNYGVGSSKNGNAIFWQIDSRGIIRSGKVMTYNADGHRDKTRPPYWVHSQLAKAGFIDLEKYEYVGCLFGEHLLNAAKMADVNICESEKTALIMSLFHKQSEQIWMATAGKGMLNEHKLLPIIQENRRIVLWPDHDAYQDWKQKAEAMKYDRIFVSDQVERAFDATIDKDNADIADIVIRLMQDNSESEYQKVKKLLGVEEENEALRLLIEKTQAHLI